MPSCGFCGSTQSGENISNCSKLMQYKRQYCEYILSKSDNGYVHLKNRLQNNLPLNRNDYPNNIVSMSMESNKGKHIVISNIWLKRLSRPQTGPKQISDMLFEISYINRQGDIEKGKHIICGEELESAIHIMKIRKKKYFIYDATASQMDMMDQEDFVFTQTTAHSVEMNTSLFNNFNQSLFARQSNMNVALSNNSQNYSVDEDGYICM